MRCSANRVLGNHHPKPHHRDEDVVSDAASVSAKSAPSSSSLRSMAVRSRVMPMPMTMTMPKSAPFNAQTSAVMPTPLPTRSTPMQMQMPSLRSVRAGDASAGAMITGVAPWASSTSSSSSSSSVQCDVICGGGISSITSSSSSSSMMLNDMHISGFDRLTDFMQRCAPHAGEGDGDGAEGNRVWDAEQAAATPTLIPLLRFHDLVFGR